MNTQRVSHCLQCLHRSRFPIANGAQGATEVVACADVLLSRDRQSARDRYRNGVGVR